MRFFLIVVALAYPLFGFTQVKKMYLNDKGDIVDASKANSYLLIQKIDDSVYTVQQYDLSNKILMRGSYKDELLTNPNGKFTYYKKDVVENPTTHEIVIIDSANYLNRVGYFINGKKEGNWIEYNKDHARSKTYTYLNDMLNGEYKEYITQNLSEILLQKGNYINGKKEGEWDSYLPDLDKPAITNIYDNDKIKKTISHYTTSLPTQSFRSYIKKNLTPYTDSLKHITIRIYVNETGRIENLITEQQISSNLYTTVKNFLINAPPLQPALYDNKPIKETRSFYITGFLSNK